MRLFKRRWTHAAAAVLALSAVMTAVFSGAATAESDAFQHTWMRTDKPVVDGQVSRTWMWGPMETAVETTEPYVQAPDGERQVMYFDKSRMEVTDPGANPTETWYVTNGLLSTELITGRMQMGDDTFEQREPAQVNVAGDTHDPTGPTYATFAAVLNAPALAEGTVITHVIDRNGMTTDNPDFAAQDIAITAAYFDDVTNHTVAAPFWEFMNSSGVVWENDSFVTAALFESYLFATGRPVTEAYWANVKVADNYQDVLMQCFERRCLTYTPDNDPGWQVEAGNVGQHYHQWRYGDGGQTGAGDPVAGEALFTRCQACHAIDGSSGFGPALNGLFGSTVLLTSGETLIAGEAYIRESIVSPQAKRSAGYSVTMPTFPFTEQEVDNLVAYIITLE